jgi:hypothetical protein
MATQPVARGGRPFGIWVICALLVLNALSLMGALAGRFPEQWDWLVTAGPLDDRSRLLVALGIVMAIAAAIGLWLLYRWGWVLAMLLIGGILLANLLLWWEGHPNYFRMAMGVIGAFYLNSTGVRQLFERRRAVSKVVLREGSGRP